MNAYYERNQQVTNVAAPVATPEAPVIILADSGQIMNDAAPPVYVPYVPKKIDIAPVGVYVDITRYEVKDNVVFGTMSVNCPSTGKTFDGYTIASLVGKPILPARTYDTYTRSDNNRPWRIELKNTKQYGWENVQIHNGFDFFTSEGCYLAGRGYIQDTGDYAVTNSQNAMTQIYSIVNGAGPNVFIQVTIQDSLTRF
jgi:hypothetical protein